MDLEETLGKIVGLSREELDVVRKRAEEKTAARDHGRDFHAMQRAADRLDHYAHQLRRLHDAEFGSTGGTRAWRTRPASSQATIRRRFSAREF